MSPFFIAKIALRNKIKPVLDWFFAIKKLMINAVIQLS